MSVPTAKTPSPSINVVGSGGRAGASLVDAAVAAGGCVTVTVDTVVVGLLPHETRTVDARVAMMGRPRLPRTGLVGEAVALVAGRGKGGAIALATRCLTFL
jgi:hypothetical protein